jgi:uncharacterized protein YdaU (DUF1376 family)
MAKPDSWMPMYWADLWNDTRHLTAIEQCAYYNLLGSMWMHGASLPDDNDRLQRMSRVTEKEWRTVKATVIAFFECREGRLYQKRLGQEYEKATKAYNARSQHMATVNSKRRQSPSTVTVTVTETTTVDTTHNSHTPDGVTDDKSSVARTRKPTERKSRLENDWKPSEQDCDYARNCNLTDAETHGIAEQFRRYFTGPDAKNPRKSDWHRAWCNWVDRDAARVIVSRSRASGPSRNRPEPSSTLAAFASVAAQMADENERSHGMGRGFEGLPNQPDSEPSGCAKRDCDGANHATADDPDRVCEAACGTENPDEIEGGKSAGFASDGIAVRPQVIDLPGRRGAEGFDDTGRPDAILARVGGTEGPSGFVRQTAHETIGGADSVEGENLTFGAKVNAAATHAPIDGDSLAYGQKNGVSVEIKAA